MPDIAESQRITYVTRKGGERVAEETPVWLKFDVEIWAAKSRKGEVCGILGCGETPVVKCDHCGNHYCEEHKFVLETPGHPEKSV